MEGPPGLHRFWNASAIRFTFCSLSLSPTLFPYSATSASLDSVSLP